MAVLTYSLAEHGDDYLSTNFRVREFACKDGSDKILICEDLVEKLQEIRDWAGAAVTITSGYRTESHNATIPGASPTSTHMEGKAADIIVSGKTVSQVLSKANTLDFEYAYKSEEKGFVHVNT